MPETLNNNCSLLYFIHSETITPERASFLAHSFLIIRNKTFPDIMNNRVWTAKSKKVYDDGIFVTSHLLDDLQTLWNVTHTDYLEMKNN